MNRANNKLKNVIKGCAKQYDLEEITIFDGYKPLYSGALDQFYSNCDINMVVYRDELLQREVIEKSILGHRKLFVFLKENKATFVCEKCKGGFEETPSISKKSSALLCPVCGCQEALEDLVSAGVMNEDDADEILSNVKINYGYSSWTRYIDV